MTLTAIVKRTWRCEDQIKDSALSLASHSVLSDSMHLSFVLLECVCARVCVCVCVCACAHFKVSREIHFVFTAQDQSLVALKLACRDFHCMSPLS